MPSHKCINGTQNTQTTHLTCRCAPQNMQKRSLQDICWFVGSWICERRRMPNRKHCCHNILATRLSANSVTMAKILQRIQLGVGMRGSRRKGFWCWFWLWSWSWYISGARRYPCPGCTTIKINGCQIDHWPNIVSSQTSTQKDVQEEDNQRRRKDVRGEHHLWHCHVQFVPNSQVKVITDGVMFSGQPVFERKTIKWMEMGEL